MEQYVLVFACVYNNSKILNFQADTEQDLPKYQTKKTPTYQKKSLKKKIIKTPFVKADSLVEKI